MTTVVGLILGVLLLGMIFDVTWLVAVALVMAFVLFLACVVAAALDDPSLRR